MKNCFILLFASLIACPFPAGAQKMITSSGMRSDVEYLASPGMNGRKNGDESLNEAARYIASRVESIGLKPAAYSNYMQSYSLIRKTLDPSSKAEVITDGDTTVVRGMMYNLIPHGPSDLTVEGEVIFAGYGLQSDTYNYDDAAGINAAGKILLIMEGAPIPEGGKPFLEGIENDFSLSIQIKLGHLLKLKPSAILVVPDPKSGFGSLAESEPDYASYLSSLIRFSDATDESIDPAMTMLPRVIFIERSLADELLEGTGTSLDELQKSIDHDLKPRSFPINGKKLIIREKVLAGEMKLNNIAGYIEGRHPVLKDEVVVYTAHYDHIGIENGKVNPGADDNASGCAALLSIAGAMQSQKKKPLRSILFLWISGEEIGLFGSEYYVNHPLFPLKSTVADLNLDMIGRVKIPADSTSQNPMTGPEDIFAITDNQSSELKAIADAADKKSRLDLDYSLSGKDHPLMLFARSDHYNFIVNDIPVLYFTAGLHTDYHTPGDIVEKMDFRKMELAARMMYNIGIMVANRKTKIITDNPFSQWEENK